MRTPWDTRENAGCFRGTAAAIAVRVSTALDESDTQITLTEPADETEAEPSLEAAADAPDSTRMLRDRGESRTRLSVPVTSPPRPAFGDAPGAPAKTSARPRYALEVISDGRSFHLPAAVGWVMAASVVMIAVLAALDPREIGLAAVERHADAIATWEREARDREIANVALAESPLRSLRLEALRRGLAPEGALAPSPCAGNPSTHLDGHAVEIARLSEAIARSAAGDAAPVSLLPSRSPIELTRGELALAPDRHLPGTVRVTSSRGERVDPIAGDTRDHKGLDISAPMGTPVIATADGVVAFAGASDPNDDHLRALLGTHVVVEHGDTGFVTLYAHLSITEVEAGAEVRAGQVIGAVGSTGRSTGSHLHYQVMRGGVSLDPLLYIADVVLTEDGEAIRWRKNP